MADGNEISLHEPHRTGKSRDNRRLAICTCRTQSYGSAETQQGVSPLHRSSFVSGTECRSASGSNRRRPGEKRSALQLRSCIASGLANADTALSKVLLAALDFRFE